MVGRLRIGAALAACVAILLSLGAGPAAAKPGQVDSRYGFNGTLDITDALPGPEFQRGVLGVAVGPAAESVVLSYALRPCAGLGTCADLFVTRVLADGSLDTAFGTRAGAVAPVDWGEGGWAVAPSGAVAVQPDGKVVVAAGSGLSAKVVRLNPDGSHDTSFRKLGEPARPAGESAVLLGIRTTVTGLALRPAGEIVVTGASNESFFLAQLTADGQPDARFGIWGARFDNFQPGAVPGDLLLPGSSTVVGGNACCAVPTHSMALAEFDAAGSLADVVKVGLPKGLGAGKPKGVSDVIAGPKGSTFVVGSAVKGTFVAKYLRNGKPDKRFGEGGFRLVQGLRSEPRSALRDSRGRILLFGSRLDVPDTAGFRARFISTVRLLPSGRNDPSYGGARPLLVVEEAGQRVGLDVNRSVGVVEGSGGLPILLGEAASDRYAPTPKGPRFGLVRFLAGGRIR